MAEDKNNKLQIRNSTVDFLVFTRDAHEEGIEVRVQDHDVWLTQKAIGQLFGVDRSVVAKHLKNIFESGELYEDSVCAKFAQTADDGKTYKYKFYSLAAIIAVGYRTNSERALQFRQWATKVLDTFTKQGYVLDKNRLINGQIFDEDYFMNRDFIGTNWNKKFIRAVQAVLNSTKGCIGRGLEFFYEAFGSDEDRFWTIMWMPEAFIIYRMKFKDNLAKKWEQAFKALPADKLAVVKGIVANNTFKDIDLSKYDQDIQYVLQFYLITRDAAKDMVVEANTAE